MVMLQKTQNLQPDHYMDQLYTRKASDTIPFVILLTIKQSGNKVLPSPCLWNTLLLTFVMLLIRALSIFVIIFFVAVPYLFVFFSLLRCYYSLELAH